EEARVTGAGRGDVARLIEAVEAAGYGATEAGEARDLAAEDRRSAVQGRRDLLLLAASAALTVPLIVPMAAALLGVDLMLPGWAALALATPVQFVAGARFYRNALKALRAFTGTMDLLVALGTSAAYF